MTTRSQPGSRLGIPSASSTGVPSAAIRLALFLLTILLPIGRGAFGQALPTAEAAPISTGFELPRVAGTLQYSISANESISSGYYGPGEFASTGVTGNLAYISSSKLYPFSMVFSGGRFWATSGQPSTDYLNLGLSQVINTHYWSFILSDSVNYLPQTPSAGLSGIPGTGDLGVPPVQVGEDTGQGVLTLNSNRVYNAAAINVQRKLTGRTSLVASGSYTTLYFIGNSSSNNGVDNTGESGSIGFNHRIDARTSFSGTYAYSRYSYGATQPGFDSQTASLAYSRQFTRRLEMSVSAGPQFTGTTNSSRSSSTAINLYGNAALSYTTLLSSITLGYSRGVNSGFGVLQGARSDSVSFRASRTFARVWNGAVTSSYTRTTSLTPTSVAPQTLVDSIQISRALMRSLSAYASYTVENQTTLSQSSAVDAFGGLFQVVGFGLTFSPAAIHLGTR